MDLTDQEKLFMEKLIEKFDQRYLKRKQVNPASELVSETPAKKRKIITNIDLDLPENKYFLMCPYEKKEEVKALGAKFDGDKKLWYIPEEFRDREDEFSKFRVYEREVSKSGVVVCSLTLN